MTNVQTRPTGAAGAAEADVLQVSPRPLAGRLDSLSRMLSRRIDGITAQHNMSADHWYALDVIVRQDGVAMNHLARALSVAAPTLTKYVDKLAVNAYVFRLADPGDRRKVLVHASSRGASVHQELLGTIAATEAEALGMFAARDRQALERMLNHYGKQAEDFTSQ